jgi:dTDP-4-dehydrorhamnose 3,5-epimerase
LQFQAAVQRHRTNGLVVSSGSYTGMLFSKCEVSEAWIIDPTAQEDERGRFMRAWCHREFEERAIDFTPVQANIGFSFQKGTIRGLHYQVAPALEAKLVRCTSGAIFDVVLDLRPASPTYRAWCGTCLSAENGRMLYIPEGCAHGCQSMVDNTEIYYMTSAFYSPRQVRGVRYDDPEFRIRWPLPASSISDQDSSWPLSSSPRNGELP